MMMMMMSLNVECSRAAVCVCVAGLSCGRCSTGFYRTSAAGAAQLECSACDCGGRAETDPPQCDHITGVCVNCRPGTTGPHCETCAAHVVPDAQCATCESQYWGIDVDGCRGLYCA